MPKKIRELVAELKKVYRVRQSAWSKAKEANNREVKFSREEQIWIWSKLAGTWQDDRTTAEIIKDIYESRTPGREIKLS